MDGTLRAILTELMNCSLLLDQQKKRIADLEMQVAGYEKLVEEMSESGLPT